MKNIYNKLKQLYEYLKSTENVRSSQRILIKNLNIARDLTRKISNIKETTDDPDNEIIYQKALKVYQAIKQLVDQKSKLHLISFKAVATAIIFTKRLNSKMTSILDTIKTASTLIPEFDGSSDKLNRVIAAIKALETIVTNANKAAAIQVILSKLSEKARSAVGDNPQEIKEIIDGLKAKCSTTLQPEVILAKLANERQTSELAKFTEQIEKLTLQLENAYVAEKVPLDTASRLAVRAGTNALASGLKNKETQLIIKAGKFETLAEAIGKATENDKNPTTNTVLFYKGPNYNHARGGHRGRNTRGNTARGGNMYHGRSHGNQNGYNSSRGRGGYGYRNGAGNRGGNNFRGGNYHPHSRVFYAQPENMPAPQPMNVGGITNMAAGPTQLPQQSNQQVPLQNSQVALANIVRR